MSWGVWAEFVSVMVKVLAGLVGCVTVRDWAGLIGCEMVGVLAGLFSCVIMGWGRFGELCDVGGGGIGWGFSWVVWAGQWRLFHRTEVYTHLPPLAAPCCQRCLQTCFCSAQKSPIQSEGGATVMRRESLALWQQ